MKYTADKVKERLVMNRDKFYQSMERNVFPKIERDIAFIIQRGWASEVSPHDLFHCHLGVDWFYPVDERRFNDIIAGRYLTWLYHSREDNPNVPKRNIMSSLIQVPTVIEINKRTVTPADLKMWEAVTLYFGLNGEDLRNCTPATFDKVFKSGKYQVAISPSF